MTSPEVHTYLEQLGSEWTGQGCAMELGCWLGATSVPLLQGLVQAGSCIHGLYELFTSSLYSRSHHNRIIGLSFFNFHCSE